MKLIRVTKATITVPRRTWPRRVSQFLHDIFVYESRMQEHSFELPSFELRKGIFRVIIHLRYGMPFAMLYDL